MPPSTRRRGPAGQARGRKPRLYPALELRSPGAAPEEAADLALAAVDDWRPIAAEDIAGERGALRAYFRTRGDRDAARKACDALGWATALVDVPDEAWAERSQKALRPVQVGRLIVTPPWHTPPVDPGHLRLVIQPSMGFGTGHHASTRLCLRALQDLDLSGLAVLDVGTGSGVLAVAAAALGAGRVVAIDLDPDALQSARENVELNRCVDRVEIAELDLTLHPAPIPADLLLANLTGALLERLVLRLTAAATRAATLIASGFQADEVVRVSQALQVAGWRLVDHLEEDGWAGLVARRA